MPESATALSVPATHFSLSRHHALRAPCSTSTRRTACCCISSTKLLTSAREVAPGRSCPEWRSPDQSRCYRAPPRYRGQVAGDCWPAAVCEPKISIIPTTVPKSPISGLIEAMVPSVVDSVPDRALPDCRFPRSNSRMTSRELPMLRSPAPRTRPSGDCASSVATTFSLILPCRYLATTRCNSPGGSTQNGATRPVAR